MTFLIGEANIAKRPEIRAKISAKLKGKYAGQPFHGIRYEGKGELNGRWQGKNAKYCAKHQWISANYGKPHKCENCGSENAPMYHWHSVSGAYLREKSDYERLCAKCHWRIHHPNGWLIIRNEKGQIAGKL